MLNKQVMIDIFTKLLFQSKRSYDEFNAADGKIGDGDLGITISKGLNEINNNFDKFEDDLGKIFMVCAQSFTKASSSSFGTLVAISFITAAKETKGTNELAIKNLPVIIEKIIDAVCSRGKSKIGDKTFVDTLSEIAKSIEENNNNFGQNVHEATLKALKDFNGKECKIGRARMFAEKSKNLNDPGMFALSKLSNVFLDQ